jgi:hypothetical protein
VDQPTKISAATGGDKRRGSPNFWDELIVIGSETHVKACVIFLS